MPTKKNTRKRARQSSPDVSAPPKKRIKKTKPKSSSLRRSGRNVQKPKEYWKINDQNENEENDSDDTYLPLTRRTRASRSNHNHNHNKNENEKEKQKQKKNHQNIKCTKSKQSKPNKNKHKNKNRSDEKEENNKEIEERSEISISEGSESENINNDTINDGIISISKQRRNIDMDLLSPHQKQMICNLPQKIDALIHSQQKHSQLLGSLLSNEVNKDKISIHLKEIKNILTKSDSLKKTQCAIAKEINLEFMDLTRNGDIGREEMNRNLQNINTKHIELKKGFEKNMESIHKQMQKMEELALDESKTNNNTENQYKVLYETNRKKIKILNDDLQNVKHEMKLKTDERLIEDKKRENEWIEAENNKRKEIQHLTRKYLMEIDDCKLTLSCRNDEFDEFKEKMNEKHVIYRNNESLLISNLKRENAALLKELTGYRQNEGTLTPNSNINTPINDINTNYNDYRKHIEDSPLNERIQSELISISNVKNLENEIKNLKEEIGSYKKQLFGKKELMKEFQDLLQKSNVEQKAIMKQKENDRNIISVYEILTSTKIKMEEKEKEEEEDKVKNGGTYRCRTIYKENESMLEYYLSLEAVHENAFCDYRLIGSHNVPIPFTNESLTENITFFSKDAPLFLKSLIQEIFIKKQ